MLKLYFILSLAAVALTGVANADPVRVPSNGVPAFEVDAPTDLQSHVDQTGCLTLTSAEDGGLLELCMRDVSGVPDDDLGARELASFGGGPVYGYSIDSIDGHPGTEFESEPRQDGSVWDVTVVKLDQKYAFVAALHEPKTKASASYFDFRTVLADHVRLIGANK